MKRQTQPLPSLAEPEQKPDYLAGLIINAGKIKFSTSDGRQWQLRQPTPEEAADGDSAYRITYNRVLNDARLRDLAGSEKALDREARIRGNGAEAAYMLPLLLEDESGQPVFDVNSPDSMKEYETTAPALVAEMTAVYFGPLLDTLNQVKKK